MSGPVYNSLFSSGSSNTTPSSCDLQLLFQLSTSTQDAVAQTVDAVRLIIASVLQLRGIVASQQRELDQLRSEINRLRGLPLPIVSPPFAGFESIGVGSSFGSGLSVSLSGLSLSGPLPGAEEYQMAMSSTPAPAPAPFSAFFTPGAFPISPTPTPEPAPFPVFSTPGTFPISPAPATNAYFPAAAANTPIVPVTPVQPTLFLAVDPPDRPKHPLPPAPFLWGAPAATPYSWH